jgi:hypothetical protein
MLDKPRGLTMEEMRKVVENGAKHAEAVEANLERAHAGILKMVRVIKEGRGTAMVGALEAGELTGEAHVIAGIVGEAQRRFFLLHRRLTDIADKHGVDIPTPRGGGDR